jgi:hypothetical protein
MSPLRGFILNGVRCSHGLRRGLQIFCPYGAEIKADSYLKLTLSYGVRLSGGTARGMSPSSKTIGVSCAFC